MEGNVVKVEDPWADWLNQSLAFLGENYLLRSMHPLDLSTLSPHSFPSELPNHTSSPHFPIASSRSAVKEGASEAGSRRRRGEWDEAAISIQIPENEFQLWLQGSPSDSYFPDGGLSAEREKDLSQPCCTAQNGSRNLLLFSGNDYLGLAFHPRVRMAAAKAAMEVGMGPRASPLVCGFTSYHKKLEQSIAKLKQTEDCLLCPTGFSANLALLTAAAYCPPLSSAASPPPSSLAIFSDSLNHASIIDGIRLAGGLKMQKRDLEKASPAPPQSAVEVHVYQHNNMDHLEALLKQSTASRKMVVTDSLFSMDGDFACLKQLVALRSDHNFTLVLDEAHATLVHGRSGGGLAQENQVENDVDIHIGTLSKAIGCQGGFIACSKQWKQLLMSRGRSFIFSTALPVPIVCAAQEAISVAKDEAWRRDELRDRVRELGEGLGMSFQSAICPIHIGSSDAALQASRYLLTKGFHVPAIRPPTVPPNSSRLRVALSASHTKEHVQALVSALKPFLDKLPKLAMFKASTQLHPKRLCGENGDSDLKLVIMNSRL